MSTIASARASHVITSGLTTPSAISTSTPLPSAAPAAASSFSSSSLNQTDFASTDFDIKAFINAQLANAIAGDAAKKKEDSTTAPVSELATTASHLSSLLMKLQLLSADMNSTLETQSQELVQAMPKALREIAFIHRESQGLRSNLSDILKDMSTIEHVKPSATAVAITPSIVAHTPVATSTPTAASAAQAASNSSAASTIEFLESIDVVKTRITRCASTLEELDRWAKRERLVDDMFDRVGGQVDASGSLVLSSVTEATFVDLAKLHSEITHMRAIVEKFQSLGVTPAEYEARASSLKGHTARLEKLSEALMEHTMDSMLADSDSAHSAASPTVVRHLKTLRQVYGEGKAAQFQAAYQSGRIKPGLAKNIIDKFNSKAAPAASAGTVNVYEPKKLDEWLASFYTEVVHFTQAEIEFAHAVFDSESATDAAANADSKKASTTSSGSEVFNFSSQSVNKASGSPSAFVYHALLSSLHAELIPLLSIWLNAFAGAHKTSDTSQKLVPLWNNTIQILGLDVSRVIAAAQSSESVSEDEQRSQQTLLVETLSSPFARYMSDYGALERRALLTTLDAMSFGGDSYEATSTNLAAAHTLVVQASNAAMDRCLALSEGTLIEPLVASLGEYYTELVQRLFSLLRRLRRIAGLDGLPSAAAASQPKKGGGADGADAAVEAAAAAESQFLSFQGGFSLLRVARAIQSDLFGLSGQDKLLVKVAGGQLVRIVRTAEEEVEEKGRKQLGVTPRAALSMQSFQTAADVSRLVFSTFLAAHPEKLKSLSGFLAGHYAPFLNATSPTASSASGNSDTHATKGFPMHHSSIASPTTTSTSSGNSVTSPGGTRGKFGVSNKEGASWVSVANSHLFSSAATLFESFISALHNLILDTMFKPVQSKLASFHEWSQIWAAKSNQGLLSSIPLPNFSLQPSEYMIQIGEHLLTLVQQLEPYVTKQEDEESSGASTSDPNSTTYLEHDALYWLNLLSKGTFKHLISSIHQIPALSERGARQLACDLEYLVNVLQALGLTIPPTILKLQVWLNWNEAQMTTMLSEGKAGDEWTLDELAADEKHMLRHVCKCRRFRQIEADKSLQAKLNN